jgi:hypothetical protein
LQPTQCTGLMCRLFHGRNYTQAEIEGSEVCSPVCVRPDEEPSHLIAERAF